MLFVGSIIVDEVQYDSTVFIENTRHSSKTNWDAVAVKLDGLSVIVYRAFGSCLMAKGTFPVCYDVPLRGPADRILLLKC